MQRLTSRTRRPGLENRKIQGRFCKPRLKDEGFTLGTVGYLNWCDASYTIDSCFLCDELKLRRV
jgi:hypothetical protein